MSFDHNTDLLLDIIWPVAKEDKHINENKENRDKEISDSIYEKLTSKTTFLINRDISNISFNQNNVLIVNELRRVLLDNNNNSNNQLEDKLNKIIMNMNTSSSKLLGGGGASSNNGTSNETKQGIKKKKKIVNKNNSKNGIKKFTKMNVLEEFKPTILTHDDIKTGNSNNINNNNNELQKSSNIKTIDTFQLINLSMDSRKLAKREEE